MGTIESCESRPLDSWSYSYTAEGGEERLRRAELRCSRSADDRRLRKYAKCGVSDPPRQSMPTGDTPIEYFVEFAGHHIPSRGRKLGCLALAFSAITRMGLSAANRSWGSGPENRGTMNDPVCTEKICADWGRGGLCVTYVVIKAGRDHASEQCRDGVGYRRFRRSNSV